MNVSPTMSYSKTVYAADIPYDVSVTGGKELLEDEVAAVATLILAGGAVKGTTKEIQERVKNAHLFAIARHGAEIVGVAALKDPEPGYRKTLQFKTGIDLPPETYPAELGYVSISEACRGGRLSSGLMAKLMSLPAGQDGVFATTKRDGFYKHALPKLGFESRGSYQNDKGETVHLLTKPAVQK
ncbi:hypothetical protein [Gemmobacter serpentinus]|uniref:hypothetical protein n=1 Tax=Gemmobacter serpentinus TaxID=2652247 RepID=UPI00124C178E|nr:hypothetical protein [Gemmobacter serpentinus]